MQRELSKIGVDRLFVVSAVAEAGSIGKAADNIGYSEAKINRDITAVEEALDLVLFERSTKGMIPTSAGVLVLRYVKEIQASISALSTDVSELEPDAKGSVTIATGDAMASYWLAPRLAEFHAANPSIELIVNVVPDTPNLIAGEADIAIQYEEPTHKNVLGARLGSIHYVAYASRDYIKTFGAPNDMFDLGRHRLIFHSGYNKQSETWLPKLEKWKEVLDNVLETNSSNVLLETCANGGGIALMPTYVEAFDNRLVRLPQSQPMSMGFWLTYKEEMRYLERGRRVIEWIKSIFSNPEYPWFRREFR